MSSIPSIPYYDNFTSQDIDLEDLLKALEFDFNYRYFDGPNYFLTGQRIRGFIEDRKRNGKPQVLTPDDGLIFHEYFAMKYVLLLNSEESFLRYHLETTFDKDMKAFRSFLEKVFRTHSELFPPDNSKIKLLISYPHNTKSVKINKDSTDYPGKRIVLEADTITRKNSDQMTSLPHLSTAALFSYLRKEKIILDKELVNDSMLAKLIQFLTGYKGSMRTDVSLFSYENADLVTLKDFLKKIIYLIDKDIEAKKPSKQ